MNPGKIYAVLLAVVMAPGLSLRATGDLSAKEERILLNREFYAGFHRLPRINRDSFLEERLNAFVAARGLVTATGEKNLFGKRYRIVLNDPGAEALGIRIVYHLHTDNLDSVGMIPERGLFEFSGRLVAYTPISTNRESYILDIIMDKGALVIE